MRRWRTASLSSTGSGSRSGELAQLLLHGPAERHEAVALVGVEVVEAGGHLVLDPLEVEGLVVEHGGVPAAVTPGQEGPLVVGATLDAVSLGQAAAPGTLLARGAVAGAGDHVVEGAEGVEAAGLAEARADEHVLVGEREDGTAQEVGDDAAQHRVALGGAPHGGQA